MESADSVKWSYAETELRALLDLIDALPTPGVDHALLLRASELRGKLDKPHCPGCGSGPDAWNVWENTTYSYASAVELEEDGGVTLSCFDGSVGDGDETIVSCGRCDTRIDDDRVEVSFV